MYLPPSQHVVLHLLLQIAAEAREENEAKTNQWLKMAKAPECVTCQIKAYIILLPFVLLLATSLGTPDKLLSNASSSSANHMAVAHCN